MGEALVSTGWAVEHHGKGTQRRSKAPLLGRVRGGGGAGHHRNLCACVLLLSEGGVSPA